MAKNLETIRHSLSHILAYAVQELYPGTKFGIGPAIENGFYYDFELPKEISEKDLPEIERKLKDLIKQNIVFKKKNITKAEAKKLFKNQPYKLELISDLGEAGPPHNSKKEAGPPQISIYESGSFIDLCKGPHVKSTKEIPQEAFKLTRIAGAYWKGDENKPMLTRIYGIAFSTKKELEKYLKVQIEAEKRDHRKLNEKLNLYCISEELGQGLITLLPNGAIIAEELEKWAKETEKKWGYIRVFTPHIASEKIFKRTGHVPYYLESMYPPMRMKEKGTGETDVYYLKPMNCAGHHLVFKSKPRSYRDLPLRIAEYGAVYRYEQSGELYGMMRVRGPIHQNDAHIFCTEEQAEEEFQKVMDLHQYYYRVLGLNKKDYFLSFAVRDPKNKGKYIGGDEAWEKAERIALRYIKKTKIPYEIEMGGAAFYGPKIDFNIKTVTGKVFSASTNQLDFFLPKAFGLTYRDKDGKEKTPVCIHRAPLGAHVRFIAFLTEHFAGAFPLWLSPIQISIIPVGSRHEKYAKEIGAKLDSLGFRCEVKTENETVSKKIREGEMQKIPYILVVGDKEVKAKSVSVRERKKGDTGMVRLTKFIERVKIELESKKS